jgi:hypothetical protein
MTSPSTKYRTQEMRPVESEDLRGRWLREVEVVLAAWLDREGWPELSVVPRELQAAGRAGHWAAPEA